MEKFPIVDTHVHLWHPKQLRYPWLTEVPALNRSYLLKDYIAACGALEIESIVFVQCDTHPDDGLKETAWVTDLATRVEPRIQGIVAWAPLEEGARVAPFVEKLAENRLVKGIRRLIQSESVDFCVQPNFVSGVKVLSRYGLSFDLCIFHPQLANAIRLVEQCPHVQFILDHIGKPDIKNQLFDPWKQEIETLAGFPNVHCKISGLVTEADLEKWTPAELQPYIQHVISCFGFDRVIYGSDWPVSTQASDYPRWVQTLKDAVSGCSSEALRNLFRDNAIKFYRLDS
ncbi:amidohydrolase family protein [Candidatus Poribacteria bacterium]|nr:amidohydrolase family protein [Candidatus Poribacteria bacterium]MYG06410.1 amidohydrolase family protein [Candidatus Poribacteria bacterium]MYK24389.1 amidohydrolase family protein [Candidatus Poribacteria bacterium]